MKYLILVLAFGLGMIAGGGMVAHDAEQRIAALRLELRIERNQRRCYEGWYYIPGLDNPIPPERLVHPK